MHEENTHKNIVYSLSPTYLMFFQILELKKLNCVLWTCTQNLNFKLHCHFKKFEFLPKF